VERSDVSRSIAIIRMHKKAQDTIIVLTWSFMTHRKDGMQCAFREDFSRHLNMGFV
jgi:hypothetical protein